MSACARPVGGRAWTTLSILKIRTLRRYLIRSPVNGDVSGPFAWWARVDDGVPVDPWPLDAGELHADSVTATAVRPAKAGLTAAISALRVGRIENLKGPRLPSLDRVPALVNLPGERGSMAAAVQVWW